MRFTNSCFFLFFCFTIFISNIYSQPERFNDFLINHNNRVLDIRHENKQDSFLEKEIFGNHIIQNIHKQDFDSSSVIDSVITTLQWGDYDIKYSYTYDSNGNMISELAEIWYGTQWGWGSEWRYTYIYDANGNMISELYERWLSSQWGNEWRCTYTYDSNGNMISRLREDWWNSQWINALRYTYTYDLNGNMILELWEDWDVSQWVNIWRYTYTYDANGDMISKLWEDWDVSQWVNDHRVTYTYDSNRNKISELWEDWDVSQWVNDHRTTYSYDSNGNMILKLNESYFNGWVNSLRYSYNYNTNGNKISELREIWEVNQWLNNWQLSYTYDPFGNMISEIKEGWGGSQWVYNWRYAYTYDSNGNMIYGNHEIWSNGNWIAWKGPFSFNDSFGRSFSFFSYEIFAHYNFLTDIQKYDIKLERFSLSQNNPNPFNPITNISYTLPKSSKVKLEIYNLLGKRVEILVNEHKPRGTYSVQFDGTYLSSGVYICRIQVEDFNKIRKMLLVK